MTDPQRTALGIMTRFVAMNGGDAADIRLVGSTYRWAHPNKGEASIGWTA